MRSARRTTLAVATAVAGVVALTGLAPAPASAAGPELSYLVLAPDGQTTARAAGRVAAAGGTVVAAYDQIGVLVARSANPAFDGAVAGAGVESVASTERLGTPVAESDTVEAGTVDAPADPTGEPLFGLQWDMRQIDVPQAHAVTTGSPDVVVGVLDSGISSSHPDLATQVVKSKSTSCLGGVTDTSEAAWNPTTSDHGTHVAGTIAAAVNGVGVTGVAPGARVAAIKVVDDAGFIFPETAVCGFVWAATHGMQVTNSSYFIDPWQFNCRNDVQQRAVWLAVQRAVRYAQSRGVLLVGSAGNINADLRHSEIGACLVLPNEAPGVVTVSAVGVERRKSYYSSYGLGVVDVTAPGGDTRQPDPTVSTTANAVLSTTFDPVTRTNGWGYKQGTSMASPHVAGVAALALSAHPGLSRGALATLLETTAAPMACPPGVYDPRPGLDQYRAECAGGARTSFYGAGLINAAAAVG